MSPTYAGKTVSDEWLQDLIGGYREGYTGPNTDEQSDQLILDRMTEKQVVTRPHAVLLGEYDTLTNFKFPGNES